MSKNLNEAAMAGNLEEVVFRLNLGEDVNQMSNKNSTALHDATTCGRVQIVKILIERWVQYDCLCPLNPLNYNITFRNPEINHFWWTLCGNYGNTVWKLQKFSLTLFSQKFRESKGLLKELPKCWFDEIFFIQRISHFSTLCCSYGGFFFFKLRFHDFFIEDVFATEKNILMHSAEGTWFDVKPPIWMQDTHYLSWMISIRLFIILLLKQYVDIFYFINFIKHFKISHNLLMYCRYIKKKHVHCYARD